MESTNNLISLVPALESEILTKQAQTAIQYPGTRELGEGTMECCLGHMNTSGRCLPIDNFGVNTLVVKVDYNQFMSINSSKCQSSKQEGGGLSKGGRWRRILEFKELLLYHNAF